MDNPNRLHKPSLGLSTTHIGPLQGVVNQLHPITPLIWSTSIDLERCTYWELSSL
jgi:hypothetical protein